MTSIGEPYVYTDVPEPLDDIQIKQDGDGFEIRLNEAAYLYPNLSSNATNSDGSEYSNKGYDGSYQRQRRRSSPKKAAFNQNQCDDDVEVVDAKKGKLKTRAAKTTKPKTPDIPDMSSNLQTPRDNIFERMWNVEDVVEKSKMRQSSVPPVKVKEEKIEVIICDTDENTQSEEQDDNENVVEYSSKRAKVKNRRKSFASVISEVNGKETINLVSPSHGASITETQNGKKTETAPVINVLASDEETSNTEERNPDPVDYTLTKFDLIKMRRAKAKSTTAKETINVGRNSKGKQTKRAASESSHYDTDEEADDENSSDDYNDSSSDVDSDETEIYSPKKTEGSGSSDDESDEGNLECPKCDARFKVVAKLKNHMLSHFSEKSYQCKICMKAFTNNFNLKRHVKIHERDDKEWKCTKCTKGFSTQKQLEMHSVREHPGFKRFKCSVCKECFAKKAGYETHMMQHINDKVKQSNCEPQVKETVKQTGHLKRKMLANTQKTELLDTNQNVSNKEQKITVHSKMTVASENVKLPHPNVNMTSSGIHTQKCSQPNKNASIVKPAGVRSQAKTNAAHPPDTKVNMCLKENDERISEETNKIINLTSPQKTNHSITRTPSPVHKPSVKDIGRRATHINSSVDPNQSFSKHNNETHPIETNGIQSTMNSSMTTSVQSSRSYISKEPKIGHGVKRDSTVITKQCSHDDNETSNNHVVETPNTAVPDKSQTINLIEETPQTQKTPIMERSTVIFNQMPQAAQRTDIGSVKCLPVNRLTEKDKAEAHVVMATAFIHEVDNKIETINVPIVSNLPDQSNSQTRRPNILSRSNLKESIPKKQLKDNTQISGSLNGSTIPVVSRSNTEFKQNLKCDTDGIPNPVPVEKQSPKSKSAADNEMFSDGEDSETPAISQQLLDHLDEIDLTSPEKCAPTEPYPKEKEESNKKEDIPEYIHKIKSAKLKSQTKALESSTIITNSKASPELTSKQPSSGQDTKTQNTQKMIEKSPPKTLEDFPHKRLDRQMGNSAQKSPSTAKNLKENQDNSAVKKTVPEITRKNSSSLAQVDHNVIDKETLKNSKQEVSEVMPVNKVIIDGDVKLIKLSDGHLTLPKVVTSTDTMDTGAGSKQEDTLIATTSQPVTDTKTTKVDPSEEKTISTAATETMASDQQTCAFGKKTLQCFSDASLTLTELPTKEVSSTNASDVIIHTKRDPPTEMTTIVRPERKGSSTDNMDLGQGKDIKCKTQSNLSADLKGKMDDQLNEVSQSDTIGSNKAVDKRVQSSTATTLTDQLTEVFHSDTIGSTKAVDLRVQSLAATPPADQLTEITQSDTTGSNKAVDLRVQSLAATPPSEPLTEHEESTTPVDSLPKDGSATPPVGPLTEDDGITTPLDPMTEDDTAAIPVGSLPKDEIATIPISSIVKDKLSTAGSLTNKETSTVSINSSQGNKIVATTVEVSTKDKSSTPLITSRQEDKTEEMSVDSQTKNDSSITFIEPSTKCVKAVVSTETILKDETETALADPLSKRKAESVVLLSEEEKPPEQLAKDVTARILVQPLTKDETIKTKVEPFTKDECSTTPGQPLAKEQTATTEGIHSKAKDHQEDILIETTSEPDTKTAVSQSQFKVSPSSETPGLKALNEQALGSGDVSLQPSAETVETINSTINSDFKFDESQGGNITQTTPATQNVVSPDQQSTTYTSNNNDRTSDQHGDTVDNRTTQPSSGDLGTMVHSLTKVASQTNNNDPTEAVVAPVATPLRSAETVVQSTETLANEKSASQTPDDTTLGQQGDTSGTVHESTTATIVQSSAAKFDSNDTNNINLEIETTKEKNRNNIAVSGEKTNLVTLPTNEKTDNCDMERTGLSTKQQSPTKVNNLKSDKNISDTTQVRGNVEHETSELPNAIVDPQSDKATDDNGKFHTASQETKSDQPLTANIAEDVVTNEFPENRIEKTDDDNDECHTTSQETKLDQPLTANITEGVVTNELPENRIEETKEDGHQTKTIDKRIDNENNVVLDSLDERFTCSSEKTPCIAVHPSSPQESKGTDCQKSPIHSKETNHGCITVEEDEGEIIKNSFSQQSNFVSNENTLVPSTAQAQLEETVTGKSISDQVDTTNQRDEIGTPSQSTLEKQGKTTSHEDGTSTENVQLPDNVLKVAKLLTAAETKGSKLADVIKELLDNAPKEERAEIRNLLQEQGLSGKTKTSKKEPTSPSASIVKRFEAKTYNSCNFFYQSSIHNKKSYHSRSQISPRIRVSHKRSRSRSRDRHFRRSRSRERKSKNEKDFRRSRSRERQRKYEKYKGYSSASTTHKDVARRSPPKHRGRSRSPERTPMHSRYAARRVRRSRSPEYRRHPRRSISPPRRISHSSFRRSRSRSRSPMHKRRHSRSPPRRGSSYWRRRSVSPKRNSRSKDIPLHGFDKHQHRSKLPSHERERESRSSCSTERSGASRRSRERPMRRSSRSSEKDMCKERRSSRSSQSTEKSTFSDHSRSSPGKSTSNKERGCSKKQRIRNVDLPLETNRVVTIVSNKDQKRDLISETSTKEMDNTVTNRPMKASDSEKDLHENKQRESRLTMIQGPSFSEIARKIWQNSEPRTSYPSSSTFPETKCGAENTQLKTKQSELYDPWENLDDQSGTTALETPVKTDEITVATTRLNQWLDDQNQKPKDTGSKLSADMTELSSFIKPSDSTTEEWKKAWYQKVDNKKLIFDTIENDSYDKNHREQQKIFHTKKEKKKENSQLLEKMDNNTDDIFLPGITTTCHSTNKEESLSRQPKSRWDKKPWDLPGHNNVGKISTAVEPVKKEKEEKLQSELQTLYSETNKDQNTWKVRPRTTVIESTSLFKDTCATEASPKSNYADFKVTIQNTAQFISVMESPASPEPELTNTETVPQILFPSRGPSKTSGNVALDVDSQNENKQPRTSNANTLTRKQLRTPDKSEVKTTPSKLSNELTHQESNSVSKGIGSGVTCNDSKRRHSDLKNRLTPTKSPKDRHPTKNKLTTEKRKSPKIPTKNSTDSIKDVNNTLKQLRSTLMILTKCATASSESIQETKMGVDARPKTVHPKSTNIKRNGVAQKPVSPPGKVRKSLDPHVVRASTQHHQPGTRNEEQCHPNDDEHKLSKHRTFSDTTKHQLNVPFPVGISFTKHNLQEDIATHLKVLASVGHYAAKHSVPVFPTETPMNPNKLPALNEQTDIKHPNPTTTRSLTANKEISPGNISSEEGHLNGSNAVSKDPRLNKKHHSPANNESKSSSPLSKNSGDKGQDEEKIFKKDLGDTKSLIQSDSNEMSLGRSKKDNIHSNETSHNKHLQDAARNPKLAKPNMLFEHGSKEEISRKNKGNDTESLSSLDPDHKALFDKTAVINSASRKRYYSSDEGESSPMKRMSNSCDHDTKEDRKIPKRVESNNKSMDNERDKDLEVKGDNRTHIDSYERDKYKENNKSKGRRLSSGDSGSSTPTLDEKHTLEGATQPSNNTEKKDHAIKKTDSFYLASQERQKANQGHYDKEKGIWRSSADSKSYWTKHPQSKGNYNDSDEREYCSYSQESKSRSVSPPRALSTGSRENETAYRCNDCYKWFDSYFELDVHKVLEHGHGNKKVYMCQVCHDGFRYHDDLDRHQMNEHRRDCPFKCTDCSDTFSSEGNHLHIFLIHGLT